MSFKPEYLITNLSNLMIIKVPKIKPNNTIKKLVNSIDGNNKDQIEAANITPLANPKQISSNFLLIFVINKTIREPIVVAPNNSIEQKKTNVKLFINHLLYNIYLIIKGDKKTSLN